MALGLPERLSSLQVGLGTQTHKDTGERASFTPVLIHGKGVLCTQYMDR
jgi:hypothetical protein